MQPHEIAEHLKRQAEINEKLFQHVEISNREMGQVQSDISWLRESFKSVDSRLWWVLGTVVLGVIVAVANILK